jgi:erythromycin esterase
MRPTIKWLVSLLIPLFFIYPCLAQDTIREVISWVKQNSIPIKYIEPGDDLSDLQPLKKVFGDVQVIGIGHASHGTHEFYKMTHRLLKFLVTEMGFTAFTLESSFSNCEPINEYILTGKGNLADVLTGQGYMAWDTEEFSDMLTWLKNYNQGVLEEKKVKFYGIDVISYFGIGRERVSAYLKKYDPDHSSMADSIFLVLASEETKWPVRIDTTVLLQALSPLEELISYFNKNKAKLISVSSLKEWTQTKRYVEIMEEGIFHSVENIPPSLSSKVKDRDEYMAQNLIYLMQNERPNTKFIFCAHYDHVSASTEDSATVGFYLHQNLGNKYYALGLFCNEGTFTARVLLPDGYFSELKSDTILSFEKSLPWILKETGKGNLYLDLTLASHIPLVNKWLDTPNNFGNGTWRYRNSYENVESLRVLSSFDGIMYIQTSTPTHPTKNALARSYANIGF